MDEDPDDPSFEPGDDPGQKKKTGFKPSSMVVMKPCENLHRYLVDKFHSSTKSKTVSVVYPGFNKYHLIVRGLFKNFKASFIIFKLLASLEYNKRSF